MGVVYKARDTERNIDVAIKTVPPDLTHHPEFLRRFQQEARALMRLHHPHIVGLIDLVQDKGSHYMVLEYVDGPSLSQALTKGPLPPERAREIALQVCDALTHAHEHNIVHRDIKPSNILLTKEGQAKVTDFGIARVLDATLGTLTGKVFGTARYASPEQIKGLKVDARSDLYSLGVVLYEMLTGRPPFLGTDDEVMEQHVRGKPVPPRQWGAEIPEGLEAIVLRCLEKDRESRYQTAEELAADLRGGEPAKEPALPQKKVERDGGKTKLIAAFTAVASLLLVGLLVVALVVWPRLAGGSVDTTISVVGDTTPAHESLLTGTATEGSEAAAESQVPVTTQVQARPLQTPSPFVGKIAFLSDRDYQDVEPVGGRRPVELYTMNPDGSDKKKLALGDWPSFEKPPSFTLSWLDQSRVVVQAKETGVGARALVLDTFQGTVDRTIEFKNTIEGVETFGFAPDWSPDGAKIAFDAYKGHFGGYAPCAIWTARGDGSGWTRVTGWRDLCDTDPMWSPDGSWLAFGRTDPPGERGLYVMRPDGTGVRLLAKGTFLLGSARPWSPDGRLIAVTTILGYVFDIAVVDTDTGSVRYVANRPTLQEYGPNWCPTGALIAFTACEPDSGLGCDPEIWVMNADGTSARKIADGCCPAWSANGEQIAFEVGEDTDAEIWIINADGSGARKVADGCCPAWQHPAEMAPRGEATATPAASPSSLVGRRIHVVQQGETFSGIARAYGVTTEQLAQANGLDDPNAISVGQALVIP